MPRPDAAQLVADNLGRLPHPNGSDIRFMHYSTFGHKQDVVERLQNRAYDVGQAIIHLLESNGYVLNHRDDPAPADNGRVQHATIVCRHCGGHIARMPLDADNMATVSRIGLAQLQDSAAHECPAAPAIETPDAPAQDDDDA